MFPLIEAPARSRAVFDASISAAPPWAGTRGAGAGLWPQPLGLVLLRGRERMGQTDWEEA